MKLVRLHDWLPRFNAWVALHRSRPFAWGEWDCVTAAANQIQEITGTDVLGDLTWANQREALRVQDQEGGLMGAVTRRLGEPLPGVAFAQRGDVVLITDPSVAKTAEGALAVCLGESVCAPSADGMAFFPLSRAVVAWRVGNG